MTRSVCFSLPVDVADEHWISYLWIRGLEQVRLDQLDNTSAANASTIQLAWLSSQLLPEKSLLRRTYSV